MTTEIVKADGFDPIKTPHFGRSLKPQELDRHRAGIGIRVEAMLNHYWQREPVEAVKIQMMVDWMDTLDQFTPDEIKGACAEWLATQSRKPNPADIRTMIVGRRNVYRSKNRMKIAPEAKPDRKKHGLTVQGEGEARLMIFHCGECGVNPEVPYDNQIRLLDAKTKGDFVQCPNCGYAGKIATGDDDE